MIRWFEEHEKISLVITFLLAIFIFYMSSKVFESSATTSWLSIVYHVSVFVALNFFLMISVLRGKENYLLLIICAVLAGLYGISDEFHQYFVPGRACTLADVSYDSFGVLLSSMFYLITIKYRKTK